MSGTSQENIPQSSPSSQALLPATLRGRTIIQSRGSLSRLPQLINNDRALNIPFGYPIFVGTATRLPVEPAAQISENRESAETDNAMRSDLSLQSPSASQPPSSPEIFSDSNVSGGCFNPLFTPQQSQYSPENLSTGDAVAYLSPAMVPSSLKLTNVDANAARGELFEEIENGVVFQRIIPKGNAILRGFEPAKSTNIPDVDFFMLAAYLGKIGNHWSPELRFFKADRNLRKSYCDNAVGMVQVKHDPTTRSTTLFCKVTPETSIRAVPYAVEMICDFDRILFTRCYGCAAQRGVCKHQLAVVAWSHYKAVEPSCTEIKCYWKKSALSCVDLTLHPSKMTPSEIGADLRSSYAGGGSFFEKLKPKIMQMQAPSMMRSQLINTGHPLDMHILMHEFCSSRAIHDKSVVNFKLFVSTAIRNVDSKLFKETKLATIDQSNSALWKLLRYGRITASTLATVAGCGKDTTAESLVNKLFGAEKLKATPAMARGLAIEDLVRETFSRDFKRKVQPGYFLVHEDYPLFGASPDGIGTDFLLEIKSPKENRNVRTYLKVDGTPTKKVLLQVLLQLVLSGKKKAFLLIPDENFEANLKYKSVVVNFDINSFEADQVGLQKLFSDSVQKADKFFEKNMFYKMIERMRPILV